jgi:predicted secreted protein
VDKPGHGEASHLPPELVDGRSRRVVVLSHCLLNQNSRYPGGATCPGVVPAALQPYLDAGAGLMQMPCPEQRSWGGVRRPPVLWALAHRRTTALVPLVLPVIERYLRWRYARLARGVARDVADAAGAGVDVLAVVGVAGSPSCGVRTTVDLGSAAQRIAGSDHDLTRAWLTEEVVAAAERPGAGLFTTALQDQLARRRLDVPFSEHRLLGPGDPQTG